jgi:protein-disulfide isomerase
MQHLSLSSVFVSVLALAAAGLLAAGCARPIEGAGAPSTATPTTATPSAAPATAGMAKGACADAALTMAPATVIATVNGKTVTAADLGPGLIRREEQLLRTYCEEVAKSRTIGLENLLADRVLQAKAEAAGKSVEDLVKAKLEEATATEPSEDAIQAFYAERSPPDAPPLEAVRPQVVAALQRFAAESAVDAMIQAAKQEATITRQLPDVRPPAMEVTIPSHTAAVGPEQAVVNVVEFADFECPYCSKAADAMNAVKKRFAGKPVRFAYRHFPLSFHPNADRAAEYSQCANAQGKFWAFHDVAYKNTRALGEQDLRAHAVTAGLDVATLDGCLQSGRGRREVDADKADAERFGVEGTPTFFVNGRPLMTGGDEASLAAAINEALAGS